MLRETIAAAIAAGALVSPAGAIDKDPVEPFCNGSSAGYCNPVREPALDPIPPDLPPRASRTSGGGSVVAAGQVGSTRFLVAGIGTITKVGPRSSAAVTVALYRRLPGAVTGSLVGSRSLNHVPASPQVTSLIVRVTCKRVRVPRDWFVVVLAQSKASPRAPLARLKSVGRVTKVNCA